MATSKPTRATIVNIAKRCIEAYDDKLVKRLDKQDDILADHTKVMNDHSLQLNSIEGKLAEIYGNGTGRKGVLDRMGETQAVQAGVLATVQASVAAETSKQELFRAEMRSSLKIRDTEDSAVSSTNKKWVTWLKYLFAPICIAAWELIKEKFHIGGTK